MKKILYLILLSITILTACEKEGGPVIQKMNIQLVYPNGSIIAPVAGVKVKVSGKFSSLEVVTDEHGKAEIEVPFGIYEISTTTNSKVHDGKVYFLNGLKSDVIVVKNWDEAAVVEVPLTESVASQLVIKELFVGGSLKDDGSGTFNFDSYLILYNNSDFPASAQNLCIGYVGPNNAQATNNFYVGGQLVYQNEGWIPSTGGFWYFKNDITIQPGQQIVVAIYNAVNNAAVHSKSINFDNPNYYAMYDPASAYKNATYYVSPAASIPSSNYLKAAPLSAGNAWISSVTSPGIFVFETKGVTPSVFGADATNLYSAGNKKVPVSWIVDGIDVFLMDNTSNKKRFTSAVDAGYVYHVNKLGYSIYRNVDKEATEAISENAGKIVYGYNLGTVASGGTTDPSEIDAEASVKGGARIIYKDTNNSSQDLHLRAKASLSNY